MGLEPTFCFLRNGKGAEYQQMSNSRQDKLTQLLRPAVEGLGYELVGIDTCRWENIRY